MNETELNDYMDRLIEISAGIASKEHITPDDTVRLKAVNQGEKLIAQALNNVKMEKILSKIEELETMTHDIDMLVFRAGDK